MAPGASLVFNWRVHHVADPDALKALVTSLNIDSQSASNLRQLLGWSEVGTDRSARHIMAGWYLLREVQWLLNTESREIVPLCGTAAQKLELVQRHEPGVPGGALKKLLNGRRTTPLGKWKKLAAAPPVVMDLNDGESIVGHSLPAVTQAMPPVAPIATPLHVAPINCVAIPNIPMGIAIPIAAPCLFASFPDTGSIAAAAAASTIEQLREDAVHWRYEACSLEDQLQWQSDALSDALKDHKVELETLQRESASTRHVLALWEAQAGHSREQHARERLEEQLHAATLRIEQLTAESVAHFGVAEPFTLRKGGLAACTDGGSRLREVGDAANIAFVAAMEMVVPGDPEGVFEQLMAKPTFRNRLCARPPSPSSPPPLPSLPSFPPSLPSLPLPLQCSSPPTLYTASLPLGAMA